jgi:hypothetical protein
MPNGPGTKGILSTGLRPYFAFQPDVSDIGRVGRKNEKGDGVIVKAKAERQPVKRPRPRLSVPDSFVKEVKRKKEK